MWSNWNPHALLVGMYKGVVTGKQLNSFSKRGSQSQTRLSDFHFHGTNCPIKEDWMIKLSLSSMIMYVSLNIKQYNDYNLETWQKAL